MSTKSISNQSDLTQASSVATPIKPSGIREELSGKVNSLVIRIKQENGNQEEENTKKGPESNGEVIQTRAQEIGDCVVDTTGTVRLISETARNVVVLAHIKAIALLTGSVVLVPAAFLATGITCMASGICVTILQSCKDYKIAVLELEKVKDKIEDASFLPILPIFENELKEVELKEPKENVLIAKLNIVNHIGFTLMGCGQMATGAIAMCEAEAAHVFHYAAVLKGAAAATAAMAASVALGIIYTIRGTVMLARSAMKYRRADKFHEEFTKACKDGTDTGINFMKKVEEERGTYYLKQRGVTTQPRSAKDLQKIDKELHTEKFKCKVSMFIAAAMILGGILAIVLGIVTAGIGPLIVGICCFVFFILMESVFLTYDSSRLLKALCDRFYKEPEWFQKLIDEEERKEKFAIFSEKEVLVS